MRKWKMKFFRVVFFTFIIGIFINPIESRALLIETGNNTCTMQYNTDTFLGDLDYPAKFKLSDGHGVLAITLHASNAMGGVPGAFVASISDAYTGLPDYFPGNTQYDSMVDLLSSGVDVLTVLTEDDSINIINSNEKDVVVSTIEINPYAYPIDFWSRLAAGMSGWQPASYYCRFVDYSGNVVVKSQIPIGDTTFIVSKNIEYIEAYSFVNCDHGDYAKDAFPGYISCETREILPSEVPEDITSSFGGKLIGIKSVDAGKYLSNGAGRVYANGDVNETFSSSLTEDGWIGFKSTETQKWLSVQQDAGDGNHFLSIEGASLRSYECFKIYRYKGNLFLYSQRDRKYIAADIAAGRPIKTNRYVKDGLDGATWERFLIEDQSGNIVTSYNTSGYSNASQPTAGIQWVNDKYFYKTDWINGQYTGLWDYSKPSGCQPNGNGTLIYSPSSKMFQSGAVNYQGSFTDGMRFGLGTTYYTDCYYEGQWFGMFEIGKQIFDGRVIYTAGENAGSTLVGKLIGFSNTDAKWSDDTHWETIADVSSSEDDQVGTIDNISDDEFKDSDEPKETDLSEEEYSDDKSAVLMRAYLGRMGSTTQDKEVLFVEYLIEGWDEDDIQLTFKDIDTDEVVCYQEVFLDWNKTSLNTGVYLEKWHTYEIFFTDLNDKRISDSTILFTNAPGDSDIFYNEDMGANLPDYDTSSFKSGYRDDYDVRWYGYYELPLTEQRKIFSDKHIINIYTKSSRMEANGKIVEIGDNGVKPILMNNCTLIPIREIVNQLGGFVYWDAETAKAICYYNRHTIKFSAGSKRYDLDNDYKRNFDVAPVLYNNQTMVPVRDFLEALGCKVVFTKDSTSKGDKITIFY